MGVKCIKNWPHNRDTLRRIVQDVIETRVGICMRFAFTFFQVNLHVICHLSVRFMFGFSLINYTKLCIYFN